MPVIVFIIAACSFVIGTGEFVIMGLLPEIASDLQVDIASAGTLVSAYALGIVVGAQHSPWPPAAFGAIDYWSG